MKNRIGCRNPDRWIAVFTPRAPLKISPAMRQFTPPYNAELASKPMLRKSLPVD
jgi:hypothetical protein